MGADPVVEPQFQLHDILGLASSLLHQRHGSVKGLLLLFGKTGKIAGLPCPHDLLSRVIIRHQGDGLLFFIQSHIGKLIAQTLLHRRVPVIHIFIERGDVAHRHRQRFHGSGDGFHIFDGLLRFGKMGDIILRCLLQQPVEIHLSLFFLTI